MDADRFDIVSRRWGATRRSLFGFVAGGGLATLLGAVDAEGKKRKRRKKKRNKKKNKTPQGPECGVCQACDNGTCQTVADDTPCANGNTCQAGVCTCDQLTQSCPEGCNCNVPMAGGPPTCVSGSGSDASSCAACPAGTVSCFGLPIGGVVCFPACSA